MVLVDPTGRYMFGTMVLISPKAAVIQHAVRGRVFSFFDIGLPSESDHDPRLD